MNELTVLEQNELTECELVIERGLKTFVEVGGALLKIRDAKLYRLEYGTFEDYCQQRWNMSRPRAYQLIDAATTVTILSTIVDKIPTTESQARPLTKLEPEIQPIVWQRAVETAPDGKVTAAHVQSVVDEYKHPKEHEVNHNQHVDELSYEESYSYDDMEDEESTEAEPTQQSRPHVSFNSGNNEWYTPSEYIDAARSVMGCIDLDPASSPEANKVVNADNFYTAADNGLQYQWLGKVWMNPPYASGLVNQFAKKMAEHVSCGDVTDAIVLVNNATETEWFRQLIGVSSCVCFPQSRVKFWKPNGDTGAPLQGQAIIYIGNGRDSFLKEFSKFGWCSIVTNV